MNNTLLLVDGIIDKEIVEDALRELNYIKWRYALLNTKKTVLQ